MTARIMNGRRIAAEIREEVAAEVATLRAAGTTPGLAVVLVGDDPSSIIYIATKEEACRAVGIFTETFRLPTTASQADVLALIHSLNADPRFHGILVQLPLPKQVQEAAVIEAVSPSKDVDGFHPVNMGRLAIGDPQFIPATPYAILEMLRREKVELGGKHAVIVGRSNIVGKPLAIAWMQKGKESFPTVTVCHTFDDTIGRHTVDADILVVAMGQAGVIRRDMVKPGAVIVDVGINRVPAPGTPRGYRTVGDVDYEAVKEVAGAITPVPGGVGPVTVAMLVKNTALAARMARSGHAYAR